MLAEGALHTAEALRKVSRKGPFVQSILKGPLEKGWEAKLQDETVGPQLAVQQGEPMLYADTTWPMSDPTKAMQVPVSLQLGLERNFAHARLAWSGSARTVQGAFFSMTPGLTPGQMAASSWPITDPGVKRGISPIMKVLYLKFPDSHV